MAGIDTPSRRLAHIPALDGARGVFVVLGPLRVMVAGDSAQAQIGWSLHDWSKDNSGRIIACNERHLGCGVVRHGRKRVPEGDAGPVGEV